MKLNVRRSLVKICALLAMLLLPAVAQAQLKLATNNGAITITGYTGSPTNVDIPSTTNGLPVTSIGNSAFNGKTSLTSVTIPNSVTSIGVQAFNFCTSLTSIAIPNSVTNIQAGAFQNCNGLTNIVIGSGVSIIGQYPLSGCTHLTTATVGILNIGSTVFSSTGNPNPFPYLTSMTLLDSVTNIAAYAFVSCGSLTNVAIGSGVASIGTGAFQGLIALKAFAVSPSNSSYSSLGGVLFDVSQSTLIQFPCGLDGSYIVPNSVTNIGNGAFGFCLYLTKIYFTGNAPSLGSSAFSYDIATIYYLPGTTGWGATYGGLATVLWNPQAQNNGSFGVQNNQFGFNITGSSNLVIVVEACTNLTNPIWTPVSTNTLNTFVGTNGTAYFSDPQWTNNPAAFYRLRSP